MSSRASLRFVAGDYPHVMPLKRGDIADDEFRFEFLDLTTPRAFTRMIEEQAYDFCEMPIVTYLQAKANGAPLSLLPATMMARLQHGQIVYDAAHGTIAPADLAGRRVGVRSWSRTTGVWVRGILAGEYGLDLDSVRWFTVEAAHVAGASDPTERVAGGKPLMAMLLDGELDAVIGEASTDDRVRTVVPDPDAAARAWCRKHGAVPINHVVVVSTALVRSNPSLVRRAYQLLWQGRQAAGGGDADIDLRPFGGVALRHSLEQIADYAFAQRLVPRRLAVEALYDGMTGDL
jgi:4,5-dihydroxyphthalate decarboxylase